MKKKLKCKFIVLNLSMSKNLKENEEQKKKLL